MNEFSYYFWTFVLGSLLGVIIETIWCLIKYRKFESRKGVIFGPFNPLYGVAAVALSFSINASSNKSLGYIFITGVVIASFIEYVCSYCQEKFTGTVSWNYKDFKWNLNGRINFVYSIIWGFLTLFWAKTFMPMINDAMPFFYDREFLTIVSFILMALDCIISLAACIRRKQRREKVYAHTKFEKHLDYFYNDEVMDKVYANSEFVDD